MGDVLAAISAESKINEVGLGFDQLFPIAIGSDW
jgi:hypothetical protein